MKDRRQFGSNAPAAAPMTCLTFLSKSEEETEALAAVIARRLPAGSVVGLSGELGAGKTCFVRGLAHGLGVDPDRVRSPSFTLINEYLGGRLPLYHIDLYRLGPADMDTLALWEYLDGDGLCAVEWFERLGECTPHLAVHFTFVAESERRLVAAAHGRRYDEILLELAGELRRIGKGSEKD
jgi:tRNA threonylcarbamoyladenosine biosynthesis protein TsaE